MPRDSIPPQSIRESSRKLQVARNDAQIALVTLKVAGLGKSEPPPPIEKQDVVPEGSVQEIS